MKCVLVLVTALFVLVGIGPAKAAPCLGVAGIEIPCPTVTVTPPPVRTTTTATVTAPPVTKTVTPPAVTSVVSLPGSTTTRTVTEVVPAVTRTQTATATKTATKTATATATRTVIATPTGRATLASKDPGHVGRLVDFVPGNPEEKAAATTFSFLGLLAGLILGGVALAVVASRSRKSGENSMAQETLTAIKGDRADDDTEVFVKTPTGRHRK